MNPRWPIYIVSKGRWQFDRRLTVRALEKIGVPYKVVVEKSELEEYRREVGNDKLLVLDPKYQAEYDTCDDLGDSKSKGPGPARNFVWDHSISAGAEWHWVMDDNIGRFLRYNRNRRHPVLDGTIFRCMEDFVERYENVAIAGPAYYTLLRRKDQHPPFVKNTRIYSCLLIRNDIPYRWRARYNEDTDLSIRVLRDGWCTVQFNAFLQHKTVTQRIPGGNTEAFYAYEGTKPKSVMLARLHPDITRVVIKYGRVHHYVDYSRFKATPLIRKKGVKVEQGVDEYGMQLVRVGKSKKK